MSPKVDQERKKVITSESIQKTLSLALDGYKSSCVDILIAGNILNRAIGDHAQALECSNKLMDRKPPHREGFRRAAQDLFSLNDYCRAESVVGQGLAVFPDDFVLLVAGYKIAVAQQDKDCSLLYARQILASHPDRIEGYRYAANDLSVLDRHEEAVKVLNKGIQRFPEDIKLLELFIQVLRAAGARNKLLEVRQRLIALCKRINVPCSGIEIDHIINLLILGNNSLSLELLDSVTPATEVQQVKINRIRSYFGLNRDKSARDALIKTVTESTAHQLHSFIDSNEWSAKSFYDHLSPFSDYILVANNPSLRFTEEDLHVISLMKKPLFVYVNNGNPAFSKSRTRFWQSNFYEMVYGRPQYSVDKDGSLLFQPYDHDSFLGCLLSEGKRYPKLLRRYNKLNDASYAKVMVAVEEIVKDRYPPSFFNREGANPRRVPSMGWFSISLFNALATYSRSHPIGVYLAGFTLSPEYILEVCNSDAHDHFFERAALDYRARHSITKTIGTTADSVAELRS